MCRMSWKSGSLNLLESCGPHRACYGARLLLLDRNVQVGIAVFRGSVPTVIKTTRDAKMYVVTKDNSNETSVTRAVVQILWFRVILRTPSFVQSFLGLDKIPKNNTSYAVSCTCVITLYLWTATASWILHFYALPLLSSPVHEILKTINSKLVHRQRLYWEACWSFTGKDTLLIFQKVGVCEEGGM